MMLQCIYQQPNPFEKFVYDSLVRKKSLFESEFILCYHTLVPKVWIVADLYSQLDPPLLSTHSLRKNAVKSEQFIADIMHQVDPNSSHYKYSLNNCHIRRTSNARQRQSIEGKLRKLKIWQQSGKRLKANDKEWIDNTIAMDYYNIKYEKKVYLGFTSYVYNESTNCQEKLGNTTFSNAIYDSSEFLTVTPCFGPISGGTKHILKVDDCFKITKPNKVHILLTDEEKSWQHEIVGLIDDDGIQFVTPPYRGNWNYDDGNRLIDLKILNIIEGLPNADIKFLYV